jgi:hypothetical protein|eukprot:COSAG01_NODE_7532_length_3163_cov_51.836815_2_plen_164_part_00
MRASTSPAHRSRPFGLLTVLELSGPCRAPTSMVKFWDIGMDCGCGCCCCCCRRRGCAGGCCAACCCSEPHGGPYIALRGESALPTRDAALNELSSILCLSGDCGDRISRNSAVLLVAAAAGRIMDPVGTQRTQRRKLSGRKLTQTGFFLIRTRFGKEFPILLR